MKTILVSIFLLLVAFPALAAEPFCGWAERDYRTATWYYSLLVIDIAQTHYFVDHGGSEMNRLLGDDPSHLRIHLAGVAAATGWTAVSCWLSPEKRDVWHKVWVFIEAVAVVTNTISGVSRARGGVLSLRVWF